MSQNAPTKELWLKTLSLILEKGFDSEAARDVRTGWPVLYSMVLRQNKEEENTEVAQLLVDAGADPTLPDDRGTSALELAVQKGLLKHVELFKRSR